MKKNLLPIEAEALTRLARSFSAGHSAEATVKSLRAAGIGIDVDTGRSLKAGLDDLPGTDPAELAERWTVPRELKIEALRAVGEDDEESLERALAEGAWLGAGDDDANFAATLPAILDSSPIPVTGGFVESRDDFLKRTAAGDPCAECTAAANQLAALLDRLCGQAESLAAEAARLNGVIAEYLEPWLRPLRIKYARYRAELDRLRESEPYRTLVARYRELRAEIEAARRAGASEAELEERFGEEFGRVTDEINELSSLLEQLREDLVNCENAIVESLGKSAADARLELCEGPDCEEYERRYGALLAQYEFLRRSWETQYARWEAAAKKCLEKDCPHRQPKTPFVPFPPNLCEKLCARAEPEEWWIVEEGPLSARFDENLIELFPPDGETPPPPAPQPDDDAVAPPPEVAPGCAECLEYYRRYVAKAAATHQRRLDRLRDRLFDDLVERYREFYETNGSLIGELLEQVRLADARLRSEACEIVTGPGGEQLVRQRPDTPAAAAARGRRDAAMRKLRELDKALDEINRRLAKHRKRLKSRYLKAVEKVQRRYEHYLARCAACDPGMPLLNEPILALAPERIDMPDAFDGDCFDLGPLVGGDPDEDVDDDDPVQRPQGDPRSEDDAEPPPEDDDGEQPPLPEEELPEAIDELLAQALPCVLEEDEIRRVRDRIAELVAERRQIRLTLESEQRRLLNVLTIAETQLKVAEGELKSAEADFEQLERDWQKVLDAHPMHVHRYTVNAAGQPTGVTFTAGSSYWNSVRGRNRWQSYEAAQTRLLEIYEETYERYLDVYDTYRQAYDNYRQFLDGAFQQGVDEFNARGRQLNEQIERLRALLAKCAQATDEQPVQPWEPNAPAPDRVEPETKEVVEELEQQQSADGQEAQRLGQELEELFEKGAFGRALERVLELDAAYETARRTAQERIDEIRRERGQGPEELRAISDILNELEVRLRGIEKQRQAAMRTLRELERRMDAQWRRFSEEIERELAEERRFIAALRLRADALERAGLGERAARARTRAAELEGRIQARIDAAKRRLKERLGGADWPTDALDFASLEALLEDTRRKAARRDALRAKIAARARALERIRNGALPTTAELFRIDPAMADEKSALDRLLGSVAVPDAFVGQRRDAPRRVLGKDPASGEDRDVARSKIDFRALMSPAAEAGVDGDLIAELLLLPPEERDRRWRALRRVLAEGVQAGEAGDDLVLAAAEIVARARLDRGIRPTAAVLPDGLDEAAWRRWIGDADHLTLLGLLLMRPPRNLLPALIERLRQLGGEPGAEDRVPVLEGLARAMLGGMARARDDTERALWNNGFELVLRELPEAVHPYFEGLLRLYRDNLPDADLDALETDALLRRLDQADDWERWRRLFHRAARKAEARDFRELFQRIVDLEGLALAGLSAVDLAATQEALAGALTAELGRRHGDPAERAEWLRLYDWLQGFALPVEGQRRIVAGLVRESFAAGDLADIRLIAELVDLTLRDGVEGALGSFEILLGAPLAEVARIVIDRFAAAPEDFSIPPDELLLLLLIRRPDAAGLGAALLHGLENEALRRRLLDVLRLWAEHLSEEGDPGAVARALVNLLEAAPATAAEGLMGIVRLLDPPVWQAELERLIGDEASRPFAERIAWMLGAEAIAHLLALRASGVVDEDVRVWIAERFLRPGGILFKPDGVSWEQMATWLYGDARYATGLQWQARHEHLGSVAGTWFHAPDKIDLDSEFRRLATALGRALLERFREINLRALDPESRAALETLRRRISRLRHDFAAEPVQRYLELRRLTDAVERIIAALTMQQENRGFFDRPGITDADRALFDRLRERVKALLVQQGNAEIFREVMRYGRWLAQMHEIARWRASLEHLARQLTLDYATGQNPRQYGLGDADKLAALNGLRELEEAIRRQRRAGREVTSLELLMAQLVHGLAADDPRRREIVEAFEAVRRLLGPGAQDGSLSIADDRIEEAKAAARRLIDAWTALTGFEAERMLEIGRSLGDLDDGELAFDALNRLADAHWRIWDDARRHFDRLRAADGHRERFDIDAYQEAATAEDTAAATDDDQAVQAQIQRRQEIQRRLQPIRDAARDGDVTPAQSEGMRVAIALLGNELDEMRRLVTEQAEAIERANADARGRGETTHADDWSGVNLALANARRHLRAAARLRAEGRYGRALTETEAAMQELGIASIGIGAEIQMFVTFFQIKQANAYYDDQTFETERSENERRRVIRIAEAVIEDYLRVRRALLTGGTVNDRQRAVLEANADLNRLLRETHLASIDQIQFFHRVETGAKALLALAAAALTAGLLAPFAEVMLARLGLLGLQALRLAGTARVITTVGSVAWETLVFTVAHNATLSLLKGEAIPQDPLEGFFKNLVIFSLMRGVSALAQPFVGRLAKDWARELATFGYNVPIFVLIGMAEHAWNNLSHGRDLGEGWTLGELVEQSIVSYLIMRVSNAVGRDVLHRALMQRIAGADSAVALRMRGLNRELERIGADHRRIQERIRELSEGEGLRAGEGRELLRQLQQLLTRKVAIARELAEMHVVPREVADQLEAVADSANTSLRNAAGNVRLLVEEIGLRRVDARTFSYREARQAELVRTLNEQGFHVTTQLGHVIARIGDQTFVFRPRGELSVRVRSRGELFEAIERLGLEGATVELMLSRPGTYRLRNAAGEVVLIEYRPNETDGAALSLPVDRPAAPRGPTSFRIARVQLREGRDPIRLRERNGEAEPVEGSLRALLDQIVVARETGQGVDLVVLPEGTVTIELAEGRSLRVGDLLRHQIVHELQAFAEQHGLNLALGVRWQRGAESVGGALVLRPGRPPRFVRDLSHFEGQNLSEAQITALTTVEIDGLTVRFSVARDAGLIRGDGGDAHVVITRTRQAEVESLRQSLPDATIANWAGPGTGSDLGIGFRDVAFPARTIEALRNRVAERHRGLVDRLLELARASGVERLGFNLARALLRNAERLEWDAMSEAFGQNAGLAEALFALLGRAGSIEQLARFVDAVEFLPPAARDAAVQLARNAWRERLAELAAELPYRPALARALLRTEWAGLREALRLETGIDLADLPQPFNADPRWQELIALLRLTAPPNGPWSGLGRTFSLRNLAELTARLADPASLFARVRLSDVPNLRRSLERLGIELRDNVEVTGDAASSVEAAGGRHRILLTERATWLDLLNEIFKAQLMRELGIDGSRPFTSEMRAVVEALSHRMERQVLRGLSESARLRRAVELERFWMEELRAIRNGELPNMIEYAPGEAIRLDVGISRSLNRRLRRLNALLEQLRLAHGIFRGDFAQEVADMIEALVEKGLDRVRVRDEARTELALAGEALARATTPEQRAAAARRMRRAERRMRAATRAARERLRLALDLLYHSSGDVVLIRGRRFFHEHASERFRELIGEYNHLTSLIGLALRSAREFLRQGRLLSAILAYREAGQLRARRNRVSERLGEEGTIDAMRERFGELRLLWPPDPAILEVIGAGRLDRVYLRENGEVLVIEEKGGSSTPGTAKYLGQDVMQGTLAHTLGTAARMLIAADNLLRDARAARGLDAEAFERFLAEGEGLTANERLALSMRETGQLVVDAWRSGKLRIFLSSTRWIKNENRRATGVEPTEVIEAELRTGPPGEPAPTSAEAIDAVREQLRRARGELAGEAGN